jgi:hypothetical protein
LQDARRHFSVQCFRDSIESSGPSEEVALINELAFGITRLSWFSDEHPNAIVHSHPEYPQLVEECLEKVSAISGVNLNRIPQGGEREASKVASRLTWMLQHRLTPTPLATGDVVFNPRFQGSGLVGALHGDLLVRGVLAEVKAGKRRAQSRDFRQLLLYAALAADADIEVQALGWINPRRGMLLTVSVEEFARRASGTPWFELKSNILNSLGIALSR